MSNDQARWSYQQVEAAASDIVAWDYYIAARVAASAVEQQNMAQGLRDYVHSKAELEVYILARYQKSPARAGSLFPFWTSLVGSRECLLCGVVAVPGDCEILELRSLIYSLMMSCLRATTCSGGLG